MRRFIYDVLSEKIMAEGTTCKKRSYDAAFKLQVIDYADHNTNRGAARKYGVDERRVDVLEY